uniref:Cdc23 domain-containing protein n=1 Tax=Caenorhabditis japonica TaxID=281687 RepID=A0A8R1E360_CAEJA
MNTDRQFSTPVQNQQGSLSRLALIQQAASRSAVLPPAGQNRHSKLSLFEVSQMSGVSISMVERAKINGQEFVEELEWLRHETTSRCFLDSEMWVNEILAYLPDKWCAPNSLNLHKAHNKTGAGLNLDSSPITSPLSAACFSPGDDVMPRAKQVHTSRFAHSLIKNKEFRRAAYFLEKTQRHSRADHFLQFRCLFLAYYQEHLENDAEGVERKTSFGEDKSQMASLYQRMSDENLRENEDVWFEYLMGLIEVELGLKDEAAKTFRSVVQREPRWVVFWCNSEQHKRKILILKSDGSCFTRHGKSFPEIALAVLCNPEMSHLSFI